MGSSPIRGSISVSDLGDAFKVLHDNAKRDPINCVVMPIAGIGILYALWRLGLPWEYIKFIICHKLCD